MGFNLKLRLPWAASRPELAAAAEPPPPGVMVPPLARAAICTLALLLIILLLAPRPLGSFLKSVKARLITKEDPNQLHKTLGIACLLNFIARFVQAGPADMGFSASLGTLLTIGAHLLLSVSSLIFKIPTKRIVGGYRIWPEYRLHSIAFACRSLALMLLVWIEQRFALEPMHALNGVIVLATIGAADFGTYIVGEAGRSSTIQDLEAPPAMRFFFSVMQFHATTGCLLGLRRYSNHFIYVWIVQVNAFLMTIRRKNLAPHVALVWTYGFMLVFGFVVCSYEAQLVSSFLLTNTIANTAAALRLGLRAPKYPMWLGMAVLMELARPHATAAWWPACYAASVSAVLAVGYRRISNPRSTAAAKPSAPPKGTEVGGTPLAVEAVKAE